MATRPQRHALIAAVLGEGSVRSQEALLARLAERGVATTQATLSRDLREMGVLKGPEGYRLAGAAPAPVRGLAATGALERVVSQYVIAIREGVGLIVLKTGPGHAQVVALEFDRTPLNGVIGTVGGDDTVFIATDTPQRVGSLAKELREVAGLGTGVGA